MGKGKFSGLFLERARAAREGVAGIEAGRGPPMAGFPPTWNSFANGTPHKRTRAMIAVIMHRFANVLPFVFPALWLAVGALFGALSGWYRLMTRFPDTPADPIFRLHAQSGSLGAVSMRGCLTLAICHPGLRVSVWRICGPFSKPFLVPWTEIAIVRGTIMFLPTATLRFGDPVVGRLVLWAHVADRLAHAAGDLWPEPGPFPQASIGAYVRSQFKLCVLYASAAGVFLASVLAIINAHKPLLVAALVLFAVVCGLGMLADIFVKQR